MRPTRVSRIQSKMCFNMVRMKGIEPSRIATLEPKSSASTYFATSAVLIKLLKSTHVSALFDACCLLLTA